MDLLIVKYMWVNKLSNIQGGSKFCSRYYFSKFNHAKICRIRALANQKSIKRLKKQKKAEKGSIEQPSNSSENEYDEVELTVNNMDQKKNTISIPSRSNVLQACITTSGLIASLGLLIRQVSHVASTEGLPVVDCSTKISFNYDTWHLQLVAGIIVLVSSCRYFLLNLWPDFAESSDAANQQVLTSLQPIDYIVVAFLPGISEELLFRGALLPLFGINWGSAIVVGALFGVLHLGSGRKYSFAIWATFVGFVYGYATIVSSSLLVPMASHAANNLVGGLLWRYSSKSQK